MFFERGIEIDCAGRHKLVLSDDRLTCFLCGWSKLTRLLDTGRKSLGFIASIGVDLVVVWVIDVDLISV